MFEEEVLKNVKSQGSWVRAATGLSLYLADNRPEKVLTQWIYTPTHWLHRWCVTRGHHILSNNDMQILGVLRDARMTCQTAAFEIQFFLQDETTFCRGAPSSTWFGHSIASRRVQFNDCTFGDVE